ncbi:myoD family inhibitor-like isoform X1 [Xyrauchen texanus]|uniref:myoD family inhibitor-like isoform X1 n=1 Tax=Xyrauchen texanus TaxID=154827 RepID=UPI002241FCB0|nr:myoD family inhibitor-like isoform X1 [Xyrauchen texanus]
METEAVDVQQQDAGQDSVPDMVKTQENHVHVHTTQPQATGKPKEVTAEIVCTDSNPDHSGNSESLTDAVITSDDALLLPDHIATLSHKIEKSNEKSSLPNGSPSGIITNDSAVICTPPTTSSGGKAPHAKTPQKCNGHPKCNSHRHPHKERPTSTLTSKSQQSFKGDASQIQRVAGDDCCVHCILACLFCEVLSLCSVMAQCLACGLECDALCCCGEAATGGLACCAENTCSVLLDCGLLEDCCQSSDCLEICLECCSICFPA